MGGYGIEMLSRPFEPRIDGNILQLVFKMTRRNYRVNAYMSFDS